MEEEGISGRIPLIFPEKKTPPQLLCDRQDRLSPYSCYRILCGSQMYHLNMEIGLPDFLLLLEIHVENFFSPTYLNEGNPGAS
jgi:hypothetical protein